MGEKASSSIPVETFRPEVDDFDEWIVMFENAVVLACNPLNDARKKELWRMWLPYKLDDSTRMIYNNCVKQVWAERKAEFRSLLRSPEEKYRWRAGHTRLVWDGEDSFHVLATKVKRTLDRNMDAPTQSDYYHEFRNALPENYQEALDWGQKEETLAEAKRLAFKFQSVLANKSGADAKRGVVGGKTVGFVGASMSDDRLKTLELSLQSMSVAQAEAHSETKGLLTEMSKRMDRLDEEVASVKRGSRDRTPSQGRNDDSGFRRSSGTGDGGGYGNRGRNSGYGQQQSGASGGYGGSWGRQSSGASGATSPRPPTPPRNNSQSSYPRSGTSGRSPSWNRDQNRGGRDNRQSQGRYRFADLDEAEQFEYFREVMYRMDDGEQEND